MTYQLIDTPSATADSTLATIGGINNSVTALSVQAGDTGNFAATNDFHEAFADGTGDAVTEIVKVTGVSGAAHTIVRGQAGTSAVSHAQNAKIFVVFPFEGLNSVLTDTVGIRDTAANILASSPPRGTIKTATDGPGLYIYDGSAWHWWMEGQEMTIPPTAGWTWTNQPTGATITQRGSALAFHTPSRSAGTQNWAMYTRGSLGATFDIQAAFNVSQRHAINVYFGLMVSDGTKLVGFSWSGNANAGGSPYVIVGRIPSPTSGVASTPYAEGGVTIGPLVWMRIVQDVTNRTFYISSNSYDWGDPIAQTANTDYLTPSIAGLFGGDYSDTTAVGADAWLLSWSGA